MSAKNLDQRGRWRSKTVAFRVSPEEDEMIELAVRLSGLTKQDYIIKKLTDRTVAVQANPRVYKALKNELNRVQQELVRLSEGSEINADLLEMIGLINQTMNGLKEGI